MKLALLVDEQHCSLICSPLLAKMWRCPHITVCMNLLLQNILTCRCWKQLKLSHIKENQGVWGGNGVQHGVHFIWLKIWFMDSAHKLKHISFIHKSPCYKIQLWAHLASLIYHCNSLKVPSYSDGFSVWCDCKQAELSFCPETERMTPL